MQSLWRNRDGTPHCPYRRAWAEGRWKIVDVSTFDQVPAPTFEVVMSRGPGMVRCRDGSEIA